MGKAITGRASGVDDFARVGWEQLGSIRSNGKTQFTEKLEKGEHEQESLEGLRSHNIIIDEVSVYSVQPLRFRVSFYSKSTGPSNDLDEDSFVGSVELDSATYGRLL